LLPVVYVPVYDLVGYLGLRYGWTLRLVLCYAGWLVRCLVVVTRCRYVAVTVYPVVVHGYVCWLFRWLRSLYDLFGWSIRLVTVGLRYVTLLDVVRVVVCCYVVVTFVTFTFVWDVPFVPLRCCCRYGDCWFTVCLLGWLPG